MSLIVELNIKNPKDWLVIEPLLKRLKIGFTEKEVIEPQNLSTSEERDAAAIQKLYALLDTGVDASYYGDPVAFQREAREDRILPFRD